MYNWVSCTQLKESGFIFSLLCLVKKVIVGYLVRSYRELVPFSVYSASETSNSCRTGFPVHSCRELISSSVYSASETSNSCRTGFPVHSSRELVSSSVQSLFSKQVTDSKLGFLQNSAPNSKKQLVSSRQTVSLLKELITDSLYSAEPQVIMIQIGFEAQFGF